MANLRRINDLRKQKLFSWKDLSEQLNISVVGLQRMIATNSTKIETLEKIAAFFNVPVAYFFDDKANENTLTEQQFFVELEKQRTFYETSIDERERGIVLYYSLAKAFLKIIYYILSRKITSKDINNNQLKTIAERFFSIDIKKLYGLSTSESTDDYAIWFEHIINKDKADKDKIDLDKLFE